MESILYRRKADDDGKGNGQTDTDSEGDEADDSESGAPTKRKKEKAAVDSDGYQEFKMPWSINLSTGLILRKITQSLSIERVCVIHINLA